MQILGRRWHIERSSSRGFPVALILRRRRDRARSFDAKRPPVPASREVVTYVFLLYEHRDNSNGSVACLNGVLSHLAQATCRYIRRAANRLSGHYQFNSPVFLAARGAVI